jgi:hypothetical protein
VNLLTNPDLSRKAARAVQHMPFALRERFITALERAKTESDLSPGFRSYLNNGYKPDKVVGSN